jgi:hypothetical protein
MPELFASQPADTPLSHYADTPPDRPFSPPLPITPAISMTRHYADSFLADYAR